MKKPEFVTPLITGTPFLHVYYKRFSHLFIDESTNLISLYITNPTVINQSSTPNFVQDTIRICLPFRMFKTVFNKLHEHSPTIHLNNITISHSLKNGFPFLYMIVLYVNETNTLI